jgi:hypothetical protein
MSGHLVLTDAYVRLATLELEDATASVALSYTADPIESGTMGSKNIKRFDGGPTDWALEIEAVINEEDHGQALFDMVGTIIEIEVRPESGPVSATNPSYTGMAHLNSYTPLGSGDWGDLVTAQLSFVAAGELERLTSAE